MDVVRRRPGPNVGKAVVVWEETGRCTTRAAGVGVQARRERFAELTLGRANVQQGLATTCKDPQAEGNRRQWEGVGLAHEPIVAMRAG
jgi:hypothetical protein